MCSSADQQIAAIGRAIEELAAEALGPGATAGRQAGATDSRLVVARLAELWAQLAELDPDIARRLPTYRID